MSEWSSERTSRSRGASTGRRLIGMLVGVVPLAGCFEPTQAGAIVVAPGAIERLVVSTRFGRTELVDALDVLDAPRTLEAEASSSDASTLLGSTSVRGAWDESDARRTRPDAISEEQAICADEPRSSRADAPTPKRD